MKQRLLLTLLVLSSLIAAAQKEHFKLLGQWTIEDEEYELTPYCFEITMDKYGRLFAKVPATYSNRVVTEWQKAFVKTTTDKSKYYFEPTSAFRDSYVVNFKTASGRGEYRSICIEINYDVKDETLIAWLSYGDGQRPDKFHDVGYVSFVKVGDVDMPELIDDKQTRQRGDEGKVAEAVDLGLSVKWASWNVGASKPEDYGGYYAWGETEEKDQYDWKTYKYVNREMESDCYWDDDINDLVYKYQRIGNEVEEDLVTNSICGTIHDVAHVKWGGDWRMPTKKEIEELENKCNKERTMLNGVEGWYFIGPNGNRIFLPSAGFGDNWGCSYNMKDWRGAACMYWSGDLITGYYLLGIQYKERDGSEAWSISFDNRGVPFGNFCQRCDGLPVRPVTK